MSSPASDDLEAAIRAVGADELGAYVRMLRGDATQHKFAAAAGITRSTLASYETGRSKPAAAQLVKIAERVGIDASEVFDELQRMREASDAKAFYKGVAATVWAADAEPRHDLTYRRETADEIALISLLRVCSDDFALRFCRELKAEIEGSSTLQVRLRAEPKAPLLLKRLDEIIAAGGRYERALTDAEISQTLYETMVDMARRKDRSGDAP